MAKKKQYRVRNWAVVTESNVHDSEVLKLLLQSMARMTLKPCFQPRENAVRNHAVSQVKDKGPKKWKEKNNYHRRSLTETANSRLKRIFGSHVASRAFDMNQLGMPESYRV